MDNDFNNNYKVVNSSKGNFNFGKSILLPFCSGIIGSALVLGVVYGVPSIKNTVIGNTSQVVSNTADTNSSNNNYSFNNLQAVSLSNYSDTAMSVADKVLPSIVGIQVEFPITSYFYRMTSTSTSTGSGVIISEDGYILTNNHVVSSTNSNSFYYSIGEATSVQVFLYNDETPYEAKIIGTDEKTDLAVLKIEKSGLKAASLGDSSSIKVGEFAMAVGSPIGLQSTVTCGIISALDRNIQAENTTYHVIQTDAAINSGNSGGALVNSKGEVIGINTLKVNSSGVEGIGFAIPINDTKDIYKELIENGKIKRPFLGIEGQTINQATADKYKLTVGVYIKSISAFSSAEKAGLKQADIITNVDGKQVTNIDELNDIIESHKINDIINVTYFRNGKTENVSVTLEEKL